MTNQDMAVAGGFLATFFIIFGIIMLVAVIFGIITIVAKWKLYEKAGEPGWSAIVPIYNVLQLVKIATGEYHLGIVWIILMGVNTICSSIQGITNFIAETSDGAGGMIALIGLPFSLISLAVCIGAAVLGGYLNYMFTKSYGQSDTMCVLSIFFAPIVFMIMAFGNDTQYIGPQGHLRLWKK